ncbi:MULTISPECIES: daptide-type RiPP [Micrococcaceae]|uniref:daptide-type RiPP n=1 Tax=unclassified Kocuria TaxID=2649579 RepID=UPI0013EAA5BD|nr:MULTISPECIES: daptide-type RiPP [unclassified Kocuria]
MTAQIENQNIDLDLGIDNLESLEAPGFWSTAAGVGAGTVVAGAIVYGGGALALT